MVPTFDVCDHEPHNCLKDNFMPFFGLKIPFLVLLSLMLGGCGFLSSSTAPTPLINPQGVVKTAYSQVGKRYSLGGASPKNGFDCSGLVWWSYRQHGVKVPRITSDQAKTGKSVSKKGAKPGDIVVFRTSNSPRGLHTGLYAGKDAFIHSPSKGRKVCVESLSLPYWKSKLVAIRRVVPQ